MIADAAGFRVDVRSARGHNPAVNSWFDSPFVLTCAAALVALALAAALVQYRRGDRWLLTLWLTLPTGALLGIYAGDHHMRWLGIPAAALLMTGPVVTRARGRRHAVSDGHRAALNAGSGAAADPR